MRERVYFELGRWVPMSEKTPPEYGEYRVKRRGRGHLVYEDTLLLNGESFVTKRNCLTRAVNEWWEEAK